MSRDFVRYTRKRDKMLVATWWHHPVRWLMRKWRRDVLELKQIALAGELAERYQGVIVQALRRVEVTHVDEMRKCITAIWLDVQGRTHALVDDHGLTSLIWCVIHEQLGERVQSLRPKLMLLQFVDELPSSDERGVLRALAFSRSDYINAADDESILTLLAKAYDKLHAEVMSRLVDLDGLTDREFMHEIASIGKQHRHTYHRWLFQS
ncbi:MAG: hypothetical protein ABW277_05205 [Longimicrobiaceae bacterium]